MKQLKVLLVGIGILIGLSTIVAAIVVPLMLAATKGNIYLLGLLPFCTILAYVLGDAFVSVNGAC